MTRLLLKMMDQLNSVNATIIGQFTIVNIQRRSLPWSHITFKAKFPLLLRLVIGLMFCLGTLCTVAILYGHLHSIPNSTSLIGLDLCATGPCFKGMTPGWTKWSTAKEAFGLTKNAQRFEHQIFVRIGSDGGAAMYPSADGLTVGLIYIGVPTDIPLTVGEIVNQFGPPCVLTLPVSRDYQSLTLYYPSVTEIADDQTLTLYYPRLIVIAEISHNRLTVDTPVRYIALGEQIDPSNMPVDPCQEVASENKLPPNITRPWRGFASISHYFGEK